MPTIPRKLKKGDTIRVVAPSRSLCIVMPGNREIATRRLEALGLTVTFSEHVEEMDDFRSSSIASRVADLHAAFADPSVVAVITVIGGFNCNQLLPYLDWDLIRANPKIFIGYSDTTALQNAMLAKADLVTYSGPAYSTFAQELHFEYTLEYFVKCLFEKEPFTVGVAPAWTDDAWWSDQQDRHPIPNEGRWTLAAGEAEGTIIGGNIGTLELLQGTPYFPHVENAILFLEDDEESRYVGFDRLFESLLQVLPLSSIRGIVFGRFQKVSAVTRKMMETLIATRPQLANIPIIGNADFGHTSPLFTFPIGGRARIVAAPGKETIELWN